MSKTQPDVVPSAMIPLNHRDAVNRDDESSSGDSFDQALTLLDSEICAKVIRRSGGRPRKRSTSRRRTPSTQSSTLNHDGQLLMQQLRDEFLPMYREFTRTLGCAAIRAIAAGEKLVEIKSRIREMAPRPKWSDVLATFCREFNCSDRTCQRWMRMAKNKETLLAFVADRGNQNPSQVTEIGTVDPLERLTLTEAMEILRPSDGLKTKKKQPKKIAVIPFSPPAIVERTIHVLGEIDLALALDAGPSQIPAKRHYAKPEDVLDPAKTWNGRLFLHPPRGAAEVWTNRLLNEFKAGNVVAAIVLVPAAVNENWFGHLAAVAAGVAFWRGELPFASLTNSAGPGKPSGRPHAIILLSQPAHLETFAMEFGNAADIYAAYRLPS